MKNEEVSRALGERILKLRRQREWTQQQLADQAGGLTRTYVTRLESGQVEVCLGVLSALAIAFELTLSALLKGI